jgi:hypothetical protein
MAKNRKQASLTNVVQYDSNFNLSIGTSTSSSFNSSGSIIAGSGFTGSLSGSVFGLGNTVSFSSSVSSDLINLEIKSASVDISITNINSVTASNIARLSNLESKSSSVDISVSSLNTFSASNDNTSLNSKTGSYATTGSNTFFGTQTYSGSVYIANDLVVQGSSSIQYISASSVSIGTNIVQLNTANPSVRFAGLTIIDSGSIGGSGSFLYDSVQDEFIFVHRGNSTNVTSSHFVLGPETYDNLGNEIYLSCNTLSKGTGKEHLVDSCIFDNGTTTCIKNNLVGTGTISGTTIYGSTVVCSPVGKFTSCIDAGSGTFSGGVTATSFNLGNGQYLRLTRNSGALQYDAFGIVVGTDNTRIISTNDFDIVNGGLVSQFKIAGSGVATFACQVNAESFYTNDTRYISNQIMSGYNANSEDSDIWINYTGYLGGTTRFRDFRIGNGKQGQIALFDGSTGAASFACSVGIGTTLVVTGTTSLSCRLSIGASDQSYASIFVGGALTTGTNQYAIITDPQLSGTGDNYAVFANARIKANTAVTNTFGVYIPSAEKLSGATITNNYALYIANQTSGTTLNYSIYSSGGLNYFGGIICAPKIAYNGYNGATAHDLVGHFDAACTAIATLSGENSYTRVAAHIEWVTNYALAGTNMTMGYTIVDTRRGNNNTIWVNCACTILAYGDSPSSPTFAWSNGVLSVSVPGSHGLSARFRITTYAATLTPNI